MSVDLRLDEGDVRMTAQTIQPLDDAVRDAGTGLRIRVGNALPLDGLRRMVEKLASGRGRICLVVPVAGGGEAEVTLAGHYEVAPSLAVEVLRLSGVTAAEEL
ncbi:MAG: hypothetical protein U1E97_05180 [Alphaproteobacteria bacterium]